MSTIVLKRRSGKMATATPQRKGVHASRYSARSSSRAASTTTPRPFAKKSSAATTDQNTRKAEKSFANQRKALASPAPIMRAPKKLIAPEPSASPMAGACKANRR